MSSLLITFFHPVIKVFNQCFQLNIYLFKNIKLVEFISQYQVREDYNTNTYSESLLWNLKKIYVNKGSGRGKNLPKTSRLKLIPSK